MLHKLALVLATLVVFTSCQTVKRFEIFELALSGSTSGNPFTLNVEVTFTLKSTISLSASRYPRATVTAFYDGNNFWKVRFSPDTEGTWDWLSSSSESSLNGHKGSVACTPKNASAHGGVIVDPEHKHHFIYEDGTRYFMMGYEADWLWALGLRGVKTNVELDSFVKMTTSYGFNQYLVNVYANYSNWGKKVSAPPRVAPTTLTPWGDNGRLDYNSMDLTYFNHFDEVMDTLKKYGAVCHLMITVWNKAVQWPAHESPQDDLFWRYVAARYGAYSNIIFDISKEANREKDSYWATRLPLLAKLNAHKRLITSHTHCPDWSYCDFISAQVHNNYYNNIIESRKSHNIPVTNVEFLYEQGPIPTYGQHSPAIVMLPVMWSLYMAGGYGAWYYDDSAWDVITMDETPGYKYCKLLKEFFSKIKYWEMEPNNDFISSTSGDTVYGLASTGKEYIAFASTKSTFSVTLSHVPSALSAEWYDPTTGNRVSAGTLGSGTHKVTPPSSFDHEAVLHLH